MVDFGSFLGGVAGAATVMIVIKATDQYSKEFRQVETSMMKFKKAGAMVATGVAIGFAALAVSSAKAAADFEQTQIAFSTMLGSVAKAEILLRDLADFARRTPFTLTGIEKNAKMLLAMSIETEDLLPTLKALGDVSSGLNVPMERLALNFGQVRVQGKLTGRELRDFAVAGVPLIAELSKNLEVSEATIKDMVSAGKIGFGDVENAFITMTSEGGKFFDLMEAQSGTVKGKISNLQDAIELMQREIGEGMLPAMTGLVDFLLATEPAWSGFFKLIGDGFTGLTVSIIGWKDMFLSASIVAAKTHLKILESNNNLVIGLRNSASKLQRFYDSFPPWLKGILGIGKFKRPIPMNASDESIIAQKELIKHLEDLQAKNMDKFDKILDSYKEVTGEIENQNVVLTEQEQLVKDLQGFKLIPATGDIYNPRSFITQSKGEPFGEFQSAFAVNQARLQGGVTINIDNVNGLDGEEVSKALETLMNNKISN